VASRLAGFDQATFGEQPFLDDARDLRSNLGNDERIGPSRQLPGERYRLRFQRDDGHVGWGGLHGCGRRLLFFAGDQEHGQQGEGDNATDV